MFMEGWNATAAGKGEKKYKSYGKAFQLLMS
jgi:hypothetical protein